MSYLLAPTTTSLSSYFDAHNVYVQQLQATNGMLDQYHQETLPQLLQVSALLSRSFLIFRIGGTRQIFHVSCADARPRSN
jgi:hypothetical protein